MFDTPIDNPADLRDVVTDHIGLHPEQHNQAHWVSTCGTTRCVAGWVCYFAGVPIDIDCAGQAWMVDPGWLPSWVDQAKVVRSIDGFYIPVDRAAMLLLDLTPAQAQMLFFEKIEEAAYDLLRALAAH